MPTAVTQGMAQLLPLALPSSSSLLYPKLQSCSSVSLKCHYTEEDRRQKAEGCMALGEYSLGGKWRTSQAVDLNLCGG